MMRSMRVTKTSSIKREQMTDPITGTRPGRPVLEFSFSKKNERRNFVMKDLLFWTSC